MHSRVLKLALVLSLCGHTVSLEALAEGEGIPRWETPELIKAAEEGDIAAVEAQLKKGADVDQVTAKGETALMMASRKGHSEVVTLLVSKNANVNLREKYGYTALIHAINNGSAGIVAALLEAGGDVNAVNAFGYSPLMRAVARRNKPIVQLLLEKKPDLTIVHRRWGSALMIAVQKGDAEIVKMLLAAGADVNAKARRGKTALAVAKAKGNDEVIGILISAGAKEDSRVVLQSKRSRKARARAAAAALLEGAPLPRDGAPELVRTGVPATPAKQPLTNGTNPGAGAASRGAISDESVVDLATSNDLTGLKKALATGANPNAVGKLGLSALAFAASLGNDEAVHLLLKAGANPNLQSREGNTALHMAAFSGRHAAAKVLVAAGADVNIQTKVGETALMRAVVRKDESIIKMLLAAKADLEKEGKGSTALIEAAASGDLLVAKLLIAAKANVNHKTKSGLTALQLARTNGHGEMVKLLKAAAKAGPQEDLFDAALNNDDAAVKRALMNGANANAADQYGRTALRLAVEKGHSAVVKLLIAAKADVDAAPDPDNVTALMVAAANGHSGMIRLLLRANANVNFRNKSGRTALGVAVAQGRHGAARTLEAAGGTETGERRRKSTGFQGVDSFLAECSASNPVVCPKLAECIVQRIYSDPLVCDMRDCTFWQRKVSEKVVDSCRSAHAASLTSGLQAVLLADWAWSQKPGFSAGDSGSASGRDSGHSPRPREKSENQKWLDCRATGRAGCGYR